MKQESSNIDKYLLQSVANALDVLDLLQEYDSLSVPEIAEKTGLTRSSVFRILATLEYKKYVRKNTSAKYGLGTKLISMGNTVSERMDVIQIGHPYLMEMTAQTGETSHMGILYGATQVRFIDKVLSTSTIRMDSLIGLGRRAHLVSCGKILLAHQTPEFLDAYMKTVSFEPMTEYSISSPDALYSELERAKSDGYALDREESEIGLVCVAAPILDANRKAIAAISASGPAERMRANMNRNIEIVKETARKISEAMF